MRSVRFPLAIFLSAFLLFAVQPIMGRYLLPWFGGGPSVWTVCLLFFQALLLAGYAYAHWLASRRRWRFQALAHFSLLACSLLFLPIAPHAEVWKRPVAGDPSLRILLLLAAAVGGPYLVLSATGPLLQRWFTFDAPEKSPWRLYALSNFGSLLALLSYPFAVEPFLRLETQTRIWSLLYAAFVALCACVAWRLYSAPRATGDRQAASAGDPETGAAVSRTTERPGWRTPLFWLALAACGSILLLATTNQVCQEIAVSPFLWIAPLSVYLLTFILTFERPGFYRRIVFAVALGVLAPSACVVQVTASGLSLRVQLGVYLAALFAACMVCHGELARSRPPSRDLTVFYLTVAGGGALGGIFVAIIAPRVFTEFAEYPIGLAAACLLGFTAWLRGGSLREWTSGNFRVRIPLMALLAGGLTCIAAGFTMGNQPVVASIRNFYGILRVVETHDTYGPRRELRHGRTMHGFQYLRPPQNQWATAYYGPHSGVAIVLNALQRPGRRVAVIGLGVGTMAAWGRPGDTFRYYEVNPGVVRVAQTWFTYLKDSKARTEIVLGDARVRLEAELAAGKSRDFDVIAVDAFSSDAIPIHLITTECADLYRQRLAPGGVLLLHISNKVLDLEPVTEGLARHLGWTRTIFLSQADEHTGESQAEWVLLSPSQSFWNRPGTVQEIQPTSNAPLITWTDDFASLWHVVRF